ncbi:MAG: hypothetical protein KatS3mg043_0803 [Rhodothermaceae bacterium]|nr:MAG: hypothetical protein KatS3mg043_0803 [Rhodothermaceae bacterium]
MRFERFADAETLSRHVAAEVVAAVRARPDLLLCPATGATPRRTYALLAEQARHDPGLFARLRLVQLDEWGGLPEGHPASCTAALRRALLDPLGVGPDRFLGWQGVEADPAGVCAALSRRAGRRRPHRPVPARPGLERASRFPGTGQLGSR